MEIPREVCFENLDNITKITIEMCGLSRALKNKACEPIKYIKKNPHIHYWYIGIICYLGITIYIERGQMIRNCNPGIRKTK